MIRNVSSLQSIPVFVVCCLQDGSHACSSGPSHGLCPHPVRERSECWRCRQKGLHCFTQSCKFIWCVHNSSLYYFLSALNYVMGTFLFKTQDVPDVLFPSHIMCCVLLLQAMLGSEDCVSALLEHGASALCRDSQGRTPLHLTASLGHTELLRTLLIAAMKADPLDSILDYRGCTPTHWAAYHGKTWHQESMSNLAIYKKKWVQCWIKQTYLWIQMKHVWLELINGIILAKDFSTNHLSVSCVCRTRRMFTHFTWKQTF